MSRCLKCCVLFFSLSFAANAQTLWTNTYPNNFDLAYGNGVYVLVGDTRRYSRDAISWTHISGPSSSYWSSVTYGNGQFLALQPIGDAALSANGIAWQPLDLRPLRPPGWHVNFRKVKFLRGAFFLMGDGGLWRSIDGRTWTQQATNQYRFDWLAANEIRAVALGGGSIATSLSGNGGWTVRPTPIQNLSGLVSFKGKFICTEIGRRSLYSSIDGANWSALSQLPDGFSGLFIGCQLFPTEEKLYASSTSGNFAVSSDGIQWKTLSSGNARGFNLIRANDSYFSIGGGNTLLQSFDLRTWRSLQPQAPHSVSLYSIAKGPDSQIISGRGGIILRREGNESLWQSVSTNPPGITSLAYHDGKYFGVSTNIKVSSDGQLWNSDPSSPTEPFIKLASLNDQLLATTWGRGVLHKTTSGWRRSVINTNLALFGLTYGNGRYLVFGDKILIINGPPSDLDLDEIPVLYSSTDLVNWTPGPTNMHAFYGGAYGNGRFVLVGAEGQVLWSEDALAWQTAQTPTHAPLLDVIFLYGRFVAVGHPGHILLSENGINWDLIPVGTYEWLNSLAATPTSIIGIGSNGAIVEAPIDAWFRKPRRGRGQNVFDLFSPLPAIIEQSSDLTCWTAFQTLAASSNPYRFNSQAHSQQYFRVRQMD